MYNCRINAKFVRILKKIISPWLPITASVLTAFYIEIAFYVYNYPNMESLVLCP